MYVGGNTQCKRPGHISGAQRRRGCRFCRRSGFLPPPGGRLPAPASRATWLGEDRSATEHDQRCRWMQRGGADALRTPGSSKDGA
eukprot:6068444-Prymnesium_polylepis.1